jgi:hypothetical protein
MQKHPVILKAVRQIEDWTRLPQQNGEAFYVLRYDVGQQYKPHVDFFGGNYLKSGTLLYLLSVLFLFFWFSIIIIIIVIF